VSSTRTAQEDGAVTAPFESPDDRHLGAFRPIKLQKAADAVIAVLADAIRGGLFEPGDLLPSERNLAGQLQVSRNVLREAIDVLRREGVLSVKRGPSGGMTVVSSHRLHEVVAGLRGKTHDLMLWALEARRSLELPAFLLAASRASDADLGALNPLVRGLEALAEEPEGFYALDQKFHREVVRLAGNPLLADFYHATLVQLAEIRQEFPVLQVQFEQALGNQHTLYAALKSRDLDRIEAALDEHLAATEIVYLGQPIGRR
jgi:GntR family transcriptional regulator, transcriptional repressor for pyruvate dehydrogenase complex